MKLKILLLIAILSSPGISTGQQGGWINIYSDASFADTTACDAVPGTLAVYVRWEGSGNSARWVRFMIAGSSGFAGTWVGDSTPYSVVGSSHEGIYILFPACFPPPIHALTVTYATDGLSSPGSYLEIVPDPKAVSGMIEVGTCQDVVFAEGGRLVINPEGVCPPLPTEPTTWGRIKALYQ